MSALQHLINTGITFPFFKLLKEHDEILEISVAILSQISHPVPVGVNWIFSTQLIFRFFLLIECSFFFILEKNNNNYVIVEHIIFVA